MARGHPSSDNYTGTFQPSQKAIGVEVHLRFHTKQKLLGHLGKANK